LAHVAFGAGPLDDRYGSCELRSPTLLVNQYSASANYGGPHDPSLAVVGLHESSVVAADAEL